MLNESCVLGWNAGSVLSLILVLIGFLVSFYLGDWHKHNQWLRAKLKK
jgi:hypothetical protein